MNTSQRRTNEPNEPDASALSGGGVQIESSRQTKLLPDGAYLMEDVMEIRGSGALTFVVCNAWLLELFEMEAGEFFFMSGRECVRPHTGRFGAFYPPFSIIRAGFKDVRCRWTGMTGKQPMPEMFTTAPMIFESNFKEAPGSAAQAKGILSLSRNRRSIEMNPAPSLLSLKAKRLMDRTYLIHPLIARIAARLDVTHEHLARQFKRDFGLSPGAYCHQLRIADSVYRLARGEEIIDVSQDVGYQDLSRFYKQFRKATKKTPGFCQMPLKPVRARPPAGKSTSKNAKT